MKTKKKFKTLAAGLAVFSMFFGSGNLVFPLILGQQTQGESFISIIGLFLTAVLMPFLGVLAMILVRGEYRQFFSFLGKPLYLLICSSIIGLIGPFGVIPRCLTIAHAGIKTFAPETPLLLFSILSCIFIFFISMKKGRLIDILGYLLTPLLLGSLLTIAIKGLFSISVFPESPLNKLESFSLGFVEGYNMMDLLAAFFFSKMVLRYFETDKGINLNRAIKAGGIGMGLLGVIYIAFTLLGAAFSFKLQNVAPEQLLMKLAYEVLGPTGGILASIAITLACLTTAMALADVSSHFLVNDLCNSKLNGNISMLLVLSSSILISTFEFSGIAKFLAPILKVVYPILIVLTLFNLSVFFVKWIYDKKSKEEKSSIN